MGDLSPSSDLIDDAVATLTVEDCDVFIQLSIQMEFSAIPTEESMQPGVLIIFSLLVEHCRPTCTQ